MNISKSSWHYKLVDSILDHPSENLCVYFWQIPWAVIAWTFMLSVFAMAMGGVGWAVISPVALLIDYTGMINLSESYENGFILGSCILVIFIVMGMFNFIGTKYKHYKHHDKSSSILPAYIQAKRNKVCPRINFTNED